MPTKVFIRALSPIDGLSNLFRAGRVWGHGEVREVEVLDQDADPPGKPSPPTTEYMNPYGKRLVDVVPDPNRMGRLSFELIQKDPRFSIVQDPEEAKEEMSELLREQTTLRAEIAELEGKRAQLEARSRGRGGAKSETST